LVTRIVFAGTYEGAPSWTASMDVMLRKVT